MQGVFGTLWRSGAPVALACACLLATLPAAGAGEWRGQVRAVSDYVTGGYTKTQGRPGAQANLEMPFDSSAYIGGWISTLDFGGARAEGIAYTGWGHALSGDVRLDLSAAAYGYDRRVFGKRAGYAAVHAALNYRDVGSFSLGFAPDPYGQGATATDLAAEFRWPLSDTVDASAAAGYTWSAAAYHYDDVHWSTGLTWYPARHVALDLRYHGSRQVAARPHSDDPAGEISDSAIGDRVVFSISIAR